MHAVHRTQSCARGYRGNPADYRRPASIKCHGDFDELIDSHPNFLALGVLPATDISRIASCFAGPSPTGEPHMIRSATKMGGRSAARSSFGASRGNAGALRRYACGPRVTEDPTLDCLFGNSRFATLAGVAPRPLRTTRKGHMRSKSRARLVGTFVRCDVHYMDSRSGSRRRLRKRSRDRSAAIVERGRRQVGDREARDRHHARRQSGLRAACGAHRGVRQRRHAVDRASDVRRGAVHT